MAFQAIFPGDFAVVEGNKTTLCSEQPKAFIITARVFFYFYILMVGLFKMEMFELNWNSEILVM